jgi:hypothetical protein
MKALLKLLSSSKLKGFNDVVIEAKSPRLAQSGRVAPLHGAGSRFKSGISDQLELVVQCIEQPPSKR